MLNDSAANHLKTKGGQAFIHNGKAEGLTLTNQPVSALADFILAQSEVFRTAIVIDDTGIKGNIDIKLDCNLTDYVDIVRALRENGLDLVKGEKEMKVLVIRDKQPDTKESSAN